MALASHSQTSATADAAGDAASTLPDTGLNPYSCLLCRRKKKKCNRYYPCNNCTRLGAECVFVRRRVSARQKPTAMERLRHLESIVGRLRNDLELDQPSLDEETPADSPSVETTNPSSLPDSVCDRPGQSQEPGIQLEAEFGKLAIANGRSRYVVNSFWATLDEEVRPNASRDGCCLADAVF
jgi:hypothetical protein